MQVPVPRHCFSGSNTSRKAQGEKDGRPESVHRGGQLEVKYARWCEYGREKTRQVNERSESIDFALADAHIQHSEAILPREIARRMGLHHTNNQHAERSKIHRRSTPDQARKTSEEKGRSSLVMNDTQISMVQSFTFGRSDSYRNHRASGAKVSG